MTPAGDPGRDALARSGRPPVDVVIPFAGSDTELEQLTRRASSLARGPSDTIVIVDNRPRGPVPHAARVGVLSAPQQRSSYYARNQGTAAGHAPWLLFLDADVEWPPNLIDAYFEPEPGECVGVLAGEFADARLAGDCTLAERYAAEAGTMTQANSMQRPMPYAQTANCLVRRAAFEAVGGFAGGIRSGGDADLCFRLQAAGWTVERREGAMVVHRNRRELSALLAQKARHGAGAAWLERRYAGSFPPRRWKGLAAWSVRSVVAAGRRGPGAVPVAAVDVLATWAFELGRLLPNSARPSRRGR